METDSEKEPDPNVTYELSSKTSEGSTAEMQRKFLKFHKQPAPKAKTG